MYCPRRLPLPRSHP